jgi:hypothetical protein
MSMRSLEEEEKEELTNEALQLLKQMEKSGLTINFISYNTVLDLYVRIGKTN